MASHVWSLVYTQMMHAISEQSFFEWIQNITSKRFNYDTKCIISYSNMVLDDNLDIAAGHPRG